MRERTRHRRGWLRSAFVLIAVTLVSAALSPAAASAHLQSGTVAVDYRVSVFHPDTAAYAAAIFQSDHGISLRWRPGHTIVLLGYLGEPVFRLDRSGLWVNAASPTALAVRLLSRAQARPGAVPRWRLERGRHAVVWHDVRAQRLPTGVNRGVWSVPLIVDGQRGRLRGLLVRFPAPSLPIWLAALAAWLLAAACPLLLRRRELARTMALWMAIIASVAVVVLLSGFALDAYASGGTWILGLDALCFLAVSVGVVLFARDDIRPAGAIGAGFIALLVGILDGAVFFHPIVLAVLPATVIRIAAVTAIGAGIGAAALGSLFLSEIGGNPLGSEAVALR